MAEKTDQALEAQAEATTIETIETTEATIAAEPVRDWTRDSVNVVAYALGIPTGNAKTLLGGLNSEESDQVESACKAGGDEAIRLVKTIVMNFQQRKAKPKVEKG
jgi:hypothetical protein